jgi:hypothetical protein
MDADSFHPKVQLVRCPRGQEPSQCAFTLYRTAPSPPCNGTLQIVRQADNGFFTKSIVFTYWRPNCQDRMVEGPILC